MAQARQLRGYSPDKVRMVEKESCDSFVVAVNTRPVADVQWVFKRLLSMPRMIGNVHAFTYNQQSIQHSKFSLPGARMLLQRKFNVTSGTKEPMQRLVLSAVRIDERLGRRELGGAIHEFRKSIHFRIASLLPLTLSGAPYNDHDSP
jgi:hypothetical protein